MKPRSNKDVQRRSRSAGASSSQSPALWPLLLRAVGVGMGTVVCVMVLLGASGADENQEAANRKKIEAMTPAERAQLKRNYEKFQKLSDAEKQRYREIHRATHNQPELNRVMRSYCNWVKTLSPWEQEDLRNATPEERIELIRKFRSAHQGAGRHRGNRNYFEVSRILEVNFMEPRWKFLRLSRTSPELFKEVIGIIEKSLPGPVNYPRPKNQMSDLDQSLVVLQTALQVKKQQDDVDGADWPRPEVVDQIQKVLDDNQYFIPRLGEKRGPRAEAFRNDLRRMQIPIFLAKGLMDQLFSSVRQELSQINPPDEELHHYFETLETKFKDYLMKLPPEEMQEKLKYWYLTKHLPPEVKKKINQQSEEVKSLIFQHLFRGLDLKLLFPEGFGGRSFNERLKDRAKERANETNDRPNKRFRGPGNRGPGERLNRDRRPGQGPLRRPGPPPEKPDA
ncbi:hypothetical protein Pan241w_60320 [Gimesia alba]|uniref:DUF3106 domain-containing protein n=1 Tax=Gimesia alba TaxID=2527973 RepID=A0A517RPW3_9PLAN|nr:hypothetical protein [Gimesia alba]QDT45904.1 hypothetical protein Pan241w_60320 [Gimesia alba]